MKPIQRAVVVVVSTLWLSACTEAPQQAGTTSKSVDQPAWQGSSPGYAAAGFQHGDRAAWEQQLRSRAQNQNEYSRAP